MNHEPLKIRTFFCPASKHVTRKHNFLHFHRCKYSNFWTLSKLQIYLLNVSVFKNATFDCPKKIFHNAYKFHVIIAWESTETEVSGAVQNLEPYQMIFAILNKEPSKSSWLTTYWKLKLLLSFSGKLAKIPQ